MATSAQWSLEGDYLEACSCDFGCPCKFNAKPSQGFCQGVIGFTVRDGRFGDTDLSGLGLALIMAAPGSPLEGDITLTLYIDEQATPAQREALATIVSGQAGGFWSALGALIGDNRGIKYAPMTMQASGSRRSFTIPDVVSLENEPLHNPFTDEEQEVMVSNSFDPFCASGRAGRSVTAVVKDPDLSFDHTGRQGYVGTFAWAGP